MGRYKLGPQGGYYDPNDSGPDQFTPQPGQQYPGMPAPQQAPPSGGMTGNGFPMGDGPQRQTRDPNAPGYDPGFAGYPGRGTGSTNIPYGSEGPGGFTGHAQDPNYWQLGQQQPAKIVAGMPSTSVDPGFNTEPGGGMPSLGLPMPGPMDDLMVKGTGYGGSLGAVTGGKGSLADALAQAKSGQSGGGMLSRVVNSGLGGISGGLGGAFSSLMHSPFGIKR